MNRKLFCLSLLSLTITACSTNVSRTQAEGNFDYANKEEAKSLITPVGLVEPRQKHEFYIPEVPDTNSPVGEKMDIRAPSLVIPMAASSRIEGNDGNPQVWFDQVIDDQVLLDFIRDAVKSQLKTDGVEITSVGDDNLVFDSGWFIKEKEGGYWFFKSVVETESKRFRYTLEQKSHGRSVAISVELIDYKKEDLLNSTTDINSIEKHRAEMSMLNTLIGEVDYQYRIYSHELLQSKAKQIDASLSTNGENEPAILVNMDLDSVWTNVPTFFRENHFEVTDLNESKNIYFTTYKRPEPSFWDNLWNDEETTLNIPDGKYKFLFNESEDKTIVTILDEDGEPLSSTTLNIILPAIKTGLSFDSLF
ncbi:outer membrane protein assembly factor BamC [Pseudocolwellia sp. HL-MZ19]|uniref:outer membrane protein assembly factor BamC n=1 Tax=unclassified Pseudocolwellia TaxID=2848178 RepID=UPI003CF75AC9